MMGGVVTDPKEGDMEPRSEAGRVIPHVWRGGGWRHHVVSWSGGYVAGKWTGHRHCSEPRCEINAEEARRG